jgi:hypothetical protein
MFDVVTLSLRTENPVDAVSRVLCLIARCGIALDGLQVAPAGARINREDFRVTFEVRPPLPFAPEHLADRVRQIPVVSDVEAVARDHQMDSLRRQAAA